MTQTIERPAVISAEKARELADLFQITSGGWAKRDRETGELQTPPAYAERPGGVYPLMNDDGQTIDGKYVVGPASYLRYPVLAEAVAGLPEGWEYQVSAVLAADRDAEHARRDAERRAELVASFEAVENPAIRAYLLTKVDERGYRKPEPNDCSYMAKLAQEDRRQPYERNGETMLLGKGPYEPLPGCKAKLHLKQALAVGYTQEAYADHSYIAIPVTIEEGSDLSVCRQNLYRFAQALRTHTGLAGSGSNWDFTLIETEAGAFVFANGRHSIAD